MVEKRGWMDEKNSQEGWLVEKNKLVDAQLEKSVKRKQDGWLKRVLLKDRTVG